MDERSLFKAYGMDPDQEIPEVTTCAMPGCRAKPENTRTIFCRDCQVIAWPRPKHKVKPDG